MDVITLSSDSESSKHSENVALGNLSVGCEPGMCDVGYVDWNDDDVRPPIDYSLSPKNEVTVIDNKIEDIITPIKPSHVIDPMDITIISDDEISPKTSSKPESDILSQTRKKPKLCQEIKEREKQLKKLEKDKLKEEKKAEQQRQKTLKSIFFENQRNLKPEENIKFLKVHIDNNIINSSIGVSVISTLQDNNIKYVVESQAIINTISWSKEKIQKNLDDFGKVSEELKITEENVLIYVLDCKKSLELIHTNELLSHIERIRSVFIDKKITVIIYGLGRYFKFKKNKRNQEMKALVNEKATKRKTGKVEFNDFPSVTKDELEFALTDLQIIGRHNCRLIETPEEFSSFLLNITKSLSQIDFKLEKHKRLNNDCGWIPLDSNPSVKVDKDGNGLLRLWQQQICQFNSVGMETAQAVVSQFNSPLSLYSQYLSCKDTKEGESLLQNLQIRRQAGILSSSRKIGPQLSKKIYKFFMSDDPDLIL